MYEEQQLLSLGSDANMLRKGIDELFATVQNYATSERFKELLYFTAHFKKYAPYNAMLIHVQCPGARYVLPPRWWLKYNRIIKTDSRPIVILQPFSPVAYVYDVSDTIVIPGKEDKFDKRLATPYVGDPDKKVDEGIFHKLCDQLRYWGIHYGLMRTGSNYAGKIEIGHDSDPLLDFSDDKKCPSQWRSAYTIKTAMSSGITAQFNTIVHELGHFFCRHIRSMYDKDWQNGIRSIPHEAKEFEAETVAWLVCRRLGVDNPSYRYLAHYFNKNGMIPQEVSIDEILKATRLVEQILYGVRMEDAFLYKYCAAFRRAVEKIKEQRKKEREYLPLFS